MIVFSTDACPIMSFTFQYIYTYIKTVNIYVNKMFINHTHVNMYDLLHQSYNWKLSPIFLQFYQTEFICLSKTIIIMSKIVVTCFTNSH